MEDSFALLEEKVGKAADLVKRLRKENRTLESELTKVKTAALEADKKIQVLQKEKAAAAEQNEDVAGLRKELDALKAERSEVRTRIGKLVELLEGLD